MNVGMLVTGLLLLALSVVSRGFGKPAWWFPGRPLMDKVALVVMPLFALLALVAAVSPLIGDGEPSPAVGIAAGVILIAMLVGAVIKVPQWVKPKWLRDENAAREAAIQQRLGQRPGQ